MTAKAANKGVAMPEPKLEEMTFEALLAAMQAGDVAHIQEIDDLVKAGKENLVGIPFFITSWKYNPEGAHGEFVTVFVTKMDNSHGFFADGSTGIKDQLHEFEIKMGGQRPIYVPKGLRVSNYNYIDPEDGKTKPSSTYYINNET